MILEKCAFFVSVNVNASIVSLDLETVCGVKDFVFTVFELKYDPLNFVVLTSNFGEFVIYIYNCFYFVAQFTFKIYKFIICLWEFIYACLNLLLANEHEFAL